MKKSIKTQLYNFTITLIASKSYSYFEINAFCNLEKAKSCITNLNFIISELIEPIVVFEDYETTVDVDKNIGIVIYNKALELFSDADWLNCLFVHLEDDRDAGQWS
jgi:hypothetical protein